VLVPAKPGFIARAVELLKSGELVAFPTETVYGLGADASNPDAVARIFAAKGRPADHPVIIHVGAITALDTWAIDVPEEARQLARSFWPGPLTLILPRALHVLDVVTGGQPTVGLRMPAHPVAHELLRQFRGGVAAPSANRFGRVSATTAQHVEAEFGSEVALILDGGPCQVGIESTIVDFTSGPAVILRPGAISLVALTQALGYKPGAPGPAAPRASGTLASHYAPRTPTELVPRGMILARIEAMTREGSRCGVLARTVLHPASFIGVWIQAPLEPEDYARALYANLRMLDEGGTARILVEAPPATPTWFAVNDRLRRAAYRP